MTVDLCL